jgi:hypothetical protein
MARLHWHGVVVKQIVALFISIWFVCLHIPASAHPYVHSHSRSGGTHFRPWYRSTPTATVTKNSVYRGKVSDYTGAVGRNRLLHDETAPHLQGPESYGRVTHAGAPDVPHEIRLPDLPQSDHFRNSVSLCEPPHFTMTEHDGCQPMR